MALIHRVMVVALAVFAGACATKSVATVQATAPSQSGVATEDVATLKAELEILAERREELKAEELALRKQKPVPSEELVRVRAEQIRLNGRESVILDRLYRQSDSAERQARGELQKETRRVERIERENAKAVSEAQLTGCAPDTVKVFPLDQRRDPFAIFPSTLRVRILNQGLNPINVDTSFRGYGTLVSDLCSGGAVTLTFKLNAWEPGQQIPLTFWTKLQNGRVSSQRRTFWLQRSRQRQLIWNDTVQINLDNR